MISQRQCRVQTDTTLIAELEDLLGAERLTAQYQRLLADLDEAMAEIAPLLPQGPSAEIAQKAHKVAGGAAILGMLDLSASLRACQEAAQSANPTSLAQHIAALPQHRADLAGFLQSRQTSA
jgi:HPt (histidine-containing phosphotransfer) domain-containing protein